MKRNINDILHFRNDISPFLAHLTRDKEKLASILNDSFLKYGEGFISSVSYASPTWSLTDVPHEKRPMFQAISFTETPISEISSLIDILGRQVDLSSFGMVFLKDNLKIKGVSPVFYLNNDGENHEDTIEELLKLKDTNPDVAKKILPLFSHFGNKDTGKLLRMDFLWEREWRFPAYRGNLEFNSEDVFIGLCPDGEIDYFENEFGNKYGFNDIPLKFIDPVRPARWYATKLVAARNRMELKYSVV